MARDRSVPEIVKGPKYDWYQRGLVSMADIFFDKKTSGNGVRNENVLKVPP